jgi:hypothetical protein
MARVHIWHRSTGEIVAVGRVMGKTGCLPVGGADQAVLEVDVADEHIATLHETHFVDTNKRSVVTINADRTQPKAV